MERSFRSRQMRITLPSLRALSTRTACAPPPPPVMAKDQVMTSMGYVWSQASVFAVDRRSLGACTLAR